MGQNTDRQSEDFGQDGFDAEAADLQKFIQAGATGNGKPLTEDKRT
jgi:hypothetical protein